MLFKDRDKARAGDQGDQTVYFYTNGKIRGEFKIGYYGNPEERFIFDLEIYEEYRGQGYGNQLIQEITTDLYLTRNIPLYLHVETNNFRALHLYEKYGFQVDWFGEPYHQLVYKK